MLGFSVVENVFKHLLSQKTDLMYRMMSYLLHHVVTQVVLRNYLQPSIWNNLSCIIYCQLLAYNLEGLCLK